MKMKRLNIRYDADLVEQISSDFDLRTPNKNALRKLIFTLDGDYDPNVMQVVNLATGVGKTYLMAAFIEYLRRQGVKNVIIVTPGKIIQAKTIQNFSQGTSRYITGAEVPPDIVTPQNYSELASRLNGGSIASGRGIPMLTFIFNIQQLIAPKEDEGATHGNSDDSMRRKARKFDETIGVLFEYLKNADDLVVIADESHLYSSSAVAFHAALKELNPCAIVGLTASTLPEDHVIYEYKLYEAIRDHFVKSPVLAFRKGGYGEDEKSEEQQLRDALQLRRIKQAYYDAYAKQNGLAHLNAILFVVCSDTDHATQITNLLRTKEFFGNELSVLQVDSKHDDEITQRMLEDLDHPDSRVLAVVSVNKLKEGWDVKNIAVVVTLRAMASEVLTQQTMGRGLRLPFGKHTSIWQIDQLDIISHQSFQELLAAENVLEQFGLEEALPAVDNNKIKQAIRNAVDQNAHEESRGSREAEQRNYDENRAREDQTDSSVHTSNYPFNNHGASNYDNDEHTLDSDSSNTLTIGVRTVDSGYHQGEFNLEPIFIKRNVRYKDIKYRFPVTTIEQKQPPINLSEISDSILEGMAQKVTSSGEVLYRKEIVAALGKKLHVVDTESAEVDSIHINIDDAKNALIKLVLDMHIVPVTPEIIRYVSMYLIPKFMKNVSFKQWTIKSLESARMQLQQLIRDYVNSVVRETKEIPVIHAQEIVLPEEYIIPIGERTYDPIESQKEFVRGRYYTGWFKSLYETESFDSFTGEYQLARLMNTSPNIIWWHRLHSNYNAYIYYTAKDKYFPDFVAYDKDGVYWIIEGKSSRGREDDSVQAKRKAAESLVRRLAIDSTFSENHWGYMIAYEDDVAKAESWDDLKALSQPVSNLI